MPEERLDVGFQPIVAKVESPGVSLRASLDTLNARFGDAETWANFQKFAQEILEVHLRSARACFYALTKLAAMGKPDEAAGVVVTHLTAVHSGMGAVYGMVKQAAGETPRLVVANEIPAVPEPGKE